jgi:hypothetical protein
MWREGDGKLRGSGQDDGKSSRGERAEFDGQLNFHERGFVANPLRSFIGPCVGLIR